MTLKEYLVSIHDHYYRDLTEKYGINVKQHPKYQTLYQLSYDQIESAKFKNEDIVKQCRGVIVDRINESIVAYPFDRFFNYGEVEASEIDWSTAKIQDKMDGSLMILYYYGGEWNVATRNSPDASGNVGEYSFTFAELFWKIAKDMYGDKFTRMLDRRCTYMFELTSPYNRVVCVYPKPTITLIGVRDMETLKEISVDEFPFLKVVNSFKLQSIDDVLKSAEQLEPMEYEGYVIVDGNFNRLKVKSPKYVLIHHMTDGFGPRRIVELAKMAEDSEVLAYFPAYKKMYEEIYAGMEKLVEEIKAEYLAVRSTLGAGEIVPFYNRKEFALEAKKYKHFTPIMHMEYYGKSLQECVNEMKPEKILELIGFKE